MIIDDLIMSHRASVELWRSMADETMKDYDRRLKNWYDAVRALEKLEQRKIMEEKWTGE